MTETPGLEITNPFDEPYFTGHPSVADDDWGLPISIDGRGFILDLESNQFLRKSVQLLNTQNATSGKDSSVTAPEVWRRNVETWHQGADQVRYDRSDSLEARYNASSGIDPWKRYGFELLNETKHIQDLPAGEIALLESIGGTLFVINKAKMTVYPNPRDNPTVLTEHAFTGVAVDSTCDGQNVYILTADGVIHRFDTVALSWNHAWGVVPSFIPARSMLAFVKGFILVGNGPSLLDYTDPANPTLVVLHRLAGWWWRAASEGLSVAYVLGGMGDRWHVHRMSIKNTGAGLDPPIVAASLPEGEFAYTISTYLGYVLIGVNSGWRFGMPDSSGQITYGQLIETPSPVRCFEGQDRFVWFGLSLPNAQTQQQAKIEERSVYTDFAGIGRADLSQFVNPMTPAAASDLQGQAYGDTHAVVTCGTESEGFGYRVFTVLTPTGGKVYVQQHTLIQSGWLRQGTMTFNSNDQKMGLYAQAFHTPLRGTIVLEIASDKNLTFEEIGRSTTQDSVSMGNMPYPDGFNAIEMRFTLTRDDDDPLLGPRVSRSEFRSLNVPGRATEWHLPIVVQEDINYRNVQANRSVLSDYDFLMELVSSRRQFVYREGERRYFLHALDFVWQPHHLTSDASTYQGTYVLIARQTQ